VQLATAAHTTDPTMEQGLEAPAPGTGAGNRGGCADEQSSAHGTARKGGEARHAVKGQASDGPVRDAGPPRRGRLETACAARSLSAEGKLRRAGKARWETSFRDEGKQGEPQDRQQGETNLHGRRGSNRRGGAKPRGRHAGRTGCPPRRETRRRGSREADSPARYDGGAIFGQPQERMSGWRAGPHGSGCDGTVGVKVKRVARTCSCMLPHPIVGTSRAPAPKASKVEEGSGEANSRGSDRGSPPVEASADVGRRRETAHQRESANIGRSGCGSPRPTPLGEAGGSRTNRPSGQIRSLVP